MKKLLEGKKLPGILCTLLLLGALVAPMAATTPVLAQSISDQYNTSSVDGWWDIYTDSPVGQEFTPALDNLTRVDVYARANSSCTVTLNVRDAAIYGTTLTSANATVSSESWYTFDVSDINVQTGYKYVIELVYSSGAGVSWAYTNSNTYAGGEAINQGSNQSGCDLRFIPYGEAPGSTWNLTVNVKPAGGGSVTLNPPGGTYADNTVVTLTAAASANYTFYRWSGDASGDGDNNPIQITMNANKTVNAHFYQGTSPFATDVVSSSGPFGNSPYNDPYALLGKPSTKGANGNFRIKLVEPAYSTGTDKEQLITTLNQGSSIVVEFDHDVLNDVDNPDGIDFIVFGNAFFSGNGTVSDATNMETYMLRNPTSCFSEPLKVSVSQDGTTWYQFTNGPYGDSLFPTQAYQWDAVNNQWTDNEMDWTKPVNPNLTVSSFNGLSAEAAIALYNGSAGGTGFDLANVGGGLAYIRYIKVEGLSGYSGGEIDGFADVAPLEE